MDAITGTFEMVEYIKQYGIERRFEELKPVFNENRLSRRHGELAMYCWMAGVIESVNEGWTCPLEMIATQEGVLEWTRLFLRAFKQRWQMVTYTRSVFMQYCAMDFHAQFALPERTAHADVQGLLGSVSRAVAVLPRNFGRWMAEGALQACESVWDKVKKLFFNVLGSYSPLVLKWCDWIETFWDQLKAKAEDFYKDALSTLRGLEEAFYWGLAMIATVSLVACVEKFLLTMGLLAQPINLVYMLVPAFTAAFCVTYSMNYFATRMQQMNQLLSFFCSKFLTSIPETLFPGLFGFERAEARRNHRQQRAARTQFGPFRMLESFADMLKSMDSKAFVEMGRVAGAFNSIKTAASGIGSMGTEILTGLWKVMDTTFGIQSRALATLSVTLGCDIEAWIKECDAMEEYFVQFGKVDIGMLKRIRKLTRKGRRIQQVLMNEGRSVAPAIATVVFKSLERLQILQKQMSLRGVVSARKMPFVVAFVGESRTGKSLVARRFAEDLCENEGLDSDQIYSRQGTDPFWSGYRREFVTMYDDFAATPNAACKSDEIELMPLVSLEPVALNMASLEEKGNIYFESEAIVYSSNFLDASPRSEIQDVKAFRNRRHALIEVERHPDPTRVYNGHNAMHCQQYHILNSQTMQREIVLDTYEELWVYLHNKWVDHGEEQVANLASFSRTRNTLKAPMRSLLDIVRPGELGIPDDALHRLRADGAYYVTNIGNVVYAMTPEGDHIWYQYDGEGALPDHGGLERVVQSVETLHCAGTLNPLVVHYLGVLIEKQWMNDDLSWRECASELDEYIREVVDNLEPAHKALLVCLQYHMASKNGKGRWFSTLWDSVKSAMADIFYKEVREWPTPLKVVIGGALVLVLGAAFWAAISFLAKMSGSAAFGAAGSAVFVANAQSRQPNRNETTEYRLRNVPAKARKWSTNVGHYTPIGKDWNDPEFAEDYDYSQPPPTFSWAQNGMLNQENQHIMNKMHANLEVGTQSYQVMVLPGKRLLLCNHYLANWRKLGKSFYCRIALSSGRTYMHYFRVDLVREIEGSELSEYSNHTLEDIPHSLWHSLCLDVEAECGKNVNALIMTLKIDPRSSQLEYTYAPLAVRVRTQHLTVHNMDYIREVPTCLEYKADTENTDCGSLIMTCVRNKWKIIGVHVAGSSGWGFANLIPSLEPPAQEVIHSATAQHFPEHYFRFYEEEVVSGSALSCVADCKPTAYVRMPKKTSLERTPDEWHLGTQVVKEPSILVADDIRLGAQQGTYDPFSTGMSKYKEPAGLLHQDILEEVVEEMGEMWHDCVDSSDAFGDVSVDVALNGIAGVEYFDSLVLGTSEGFPHCLEREGGEKGKSRFVQGEIGHLSLVPGTSVERALQQLRETVKTSVPTLFGIECPKDELLPLRKIYDKPKTRLFTVLPMEYNILIRQQYLGFVKFVMRNRRKLACKVGTNPYSREWNAIATDLLEKGNTILCCDYSSFDGLCSKQLMDAILGVIQRVTKETGASWEAKRNTLLAANSRYAIAQAKVWRVEGGIPSGIPLTVILNSMMNEILIRYYYKACFRSEPILRNSFKNFVSLAVYGDDNLISVSSAIKETFNGKFLQEAMAKDGITITDGVDKTLPTLAFRQIEQCDFLKRKFILNKEGVFVGPLEKASLWGQLHYVRERHSEKIEAYLTNAENVCRELYLHGKNEAAAFRKKVLALNLFPAIQFPSIGQIEAFYAEQMGNRCGNFNLSVDMMLNPELLGTLTPINTPGQNGTYCLVPNIYYGSYISHDRQEDEYLVLCGVQGTEAENQLVIKFPYGMGRGGLPSLQWLKENFMRKGCTMLSKISAQYKNGKKIVFLSGNGNVIGMVFSVLFALASKIVDTAIANVALSAAIEKCSSLGYLTRELAEAFVGKQKW
ncbi:TPA_asm: polyprotein [Boehmeria nivea secovirus]|uniref:RNA1 polyprotein n=1 Tax=Boehmeria nivea secovirus TaxID=2936687 RepID=A0A9N6YJV3_9SECO|nr:TPA_asm: polyprotein [Boehmeria nivea secovirus]